MSKDSITLASATETSAGGGSLCLIFIGLSSCGFLNNRPEETVKLPCRFKVGGSSVLGGNTAELIGDVGTTQERRVLVFGSELKVPSLCRGRLFVRVGAEVSNLGDSIGEVCTGAGSTGFPLPFDLGLEDLVGPASVSSVASRRRFPRRGDSSPTLPSVGLAGVDEATGLNASIGEDWMISSVGMTCFGLVNTILRGDGSLRDRAADAVETEVLISVPLTGVRNADATGSVVSTPETASRWDSTGGS